MEESYWGRYKEYNSPSVRFDPLQTFLVNGEPNGFRVHIVPERSKRPRELKLPSVIDHTSQVVNNVNFASADSVLTRVAIGEEESIPIAGDNEIIGDIDDFPAIHKLEKYRGVAILNKYSPFDINSMQANGIALVSYPIQYTDNLDNTKPIINLLQPLVSMTRFILEESKHAKNFKSSLTFINVGRTSGASLRHLHAQTYMLPRNSGLVSYAFERSFEQYDNCLTCNMATRDVITDCLGQNLDIRKRILWEDKYTRLIVPYAPIRFLGLRILIKSHLSWIGELDSDEIASISFALSLAHRIMANVSSSGKMIRSDRTIGFRQSTDVNRDFHMFIDILPSIPYGGAEIIDSLSINPIYPEKLAEKMKKILPSVISNSISNKK